MRRCRIKHGVPQTAWRAGKETPGLKTWQAKHPDEIRPNLVTATKDIKTGEIYSSGENTVPHVAIAEYLNTKKNMPFEQMEPGYLTKDNTLIFRPEDIRAEMAKEAPKSLVKPGFVRLYRGEGEALGDYFEPSQFKGMWWTDNLKTTQSYTKPVLGKETGKTYYIDIPKSEIEKYKVSKNPEAVKYSFQPEEEYLIPLELTKGRKLIEVPKSLVKPGKVGINWSAVERGIYEGREGLTGPVKYVIDRQRGEFVISEWGEKGAKKIGSAKTLDQAKVLAKSSTVEVKKIDPSKIIWDKE